MHTPLGRRGGPPNSNHVSGSAMKVRKASASAVVRFATMPLPVMVVCRKLDGELSSPRAWRSVTI
jgi:hypothetical protein